MKRIVFLSSFIFISTCAFAAPFKNAENIVDNFFNKGHSIKIIENENNIRYFSKSTVSMIEVDENDMQFEMFDSDSKSYNIKRWNIESDENGNIIITRK